MCAQVFANVSTKSSSISQLSSLVSLHGFAGSAYMRKTTVFNKQAKSHKKNIHENGTMQKEALLSKAITSLKLYTILFALNVILLMDLNVKWRIISSLTSPSVQASMSVQDMRTKYLQELFVPSSVDLWVSPSPELHLKSILV